MSLDEVSSPAEVFGFFAGKILSYPDMLNHVFLWTLLFTVIIHAVAAIIAIVQLRRHTYGRFYGVVMLAVGFIYPLTGGVITSALIAGVYWTAGFPMNQAHSLFWGIGQAGALVVVSFTRILATL